MSKLREAIVKPRPNTFFIYGPPGVGKTEITSQFKNPLYICDQDEDGVQDLVNYGFIKVHDIWYSNSFDLFTDLLEKAIDEDCSTVVIETLAGWESLMHQKEFESKRGDKGYKSWEDFMSFNRGPRSCGTYISDVILRLQSLRSSGKTVVMTGHAGVKNFRNPIGSDYDKMFPECRCIKETWSPLAKWFQNIFYMNLDFTMSDSANIIERKKAESCGDRVFHVTPHPAYEAKNRFHLSDSINLGSSASEGFANMTAAIKESIKQ